MRRVTIDEEIARNLRSIEQLASALPDGQRFQVLNKVRQTRLALKRAPAASVAPAAAPAEAPYKAILAALLAGRRLSQLDCREFGIEDMRTPVSHLRRRYDATHVLRSEWITTPVHARPIKRYWLEEREAPTA